MIQPWNNEKATDRNATAMFNISLTEKILGRENIRKNAKKTVY